MISPWNSSPLSPPLAFKGGQNVCVLLRSPAFRRAASPRQQHPNGCSAASDTGAGGDVVMPLFRRPGCAITVDQVPADGRAVVLPQPLPKRLAPEREPTLATPPRLTTMHPGGPRTFGCYGVGSRHEGDQGGERQSKEEALLMRQIASVRVQCCLSPKRRLAFASA